jgi:hypothetical protein
MDNDGGSIRLSRAEALVLDAFFRRWHTGDYGDTLKIADEIERFCVINLSADIEGVAMDELLGATYNERLQEARDQLRREHELGG